jgi:hypothetical protein
LAGVHGTRRLGGRGFLLHSHSQGIKRTVVAFVLAGNTLRNGLAAFEAAGGVEVCALAARVERNAALGTLACGLNSSRQKRATLGAAGNRVCARHLHRTRAEKYLSWRGAPRAPRKTASPAFLLSPDIRAGGTLPRRPPDGLTLSLAAGIVASACHGFGRLEGAILGASSVTGTEL